MVVVAVVVVVVVVLVLVLLVVQEPPQEMEGLPVRSQEYPDTHTHTYTGKRGIVAAVSRTYTCIY